MENNDINPLVCFFDSGIGGISLLYECVRKLPRVDFTYFADNYNMPYGNLAHDKILSMTDGIFARIAELKPSAVVVACNTVTAQCVEFLRSKYKFNIIGIQPAIKPAAAAGGKCLVLATPSTAHSGAINRLVTQFGGKDTEITACPNLAAYIEKNVFDISPKEILKLLPKVKPESVVLGCTHYIFVKKIIEDYYGCPVYDGIDGTANRLCSVLEYFTYKEPRAQRVKFVGGDMNKNRQVFNLMLRQRGNFSQKN